MTRIYLPNKMIRAGIIKEFYGDKRVFCFSCGNATQALRFIGVNVIGIDNTSHIKAVDYINAKEAEHIFNCPNVTSGCLSINLIKEISLAMRRHLPADIYKSDKLVYVPVGSGETILALSFSIKASRIVGLASTTYEPIKFSFYTPLYDWILENCHHIKTDKKNIKEWKASVEKEDCYFIDTEGGN